MVEQDAEVATLDNGLTVVTERVTGRRPVALGFWARAGSAHEPPQLAGVTHFMEHMVFRGTERRPGEEIDRAMAAVGGELNGFVEREFTCFHARCLAEHVGLPIEIIADMLLNALFRSEDIGREVSIIAEEIAGYEDSPSDVANDLIAEAMWGEHPIARRVFGELDNVRALSPAQLRRQAARTFAPSRLLVAAAGDISHEQLVDELARHFEGQPPADAEEHFATLDAGAGRVLLRRDGGPVHLRVGAPAYGRRDDRRFAARMVCGALGVGPSSRLFRAVRQERGLAYDVGADAATYSCGGAFLLHAACAAPAVPEVLRLFRAELRDVAAHGLTDDELAQTKQQIVCQTEMALDDVGVRMDRLADSYMHHGRVVPVQEVLDRVRGVTMDEVVEVATDMFTDSPLALAAVGPVDENSLEAA
ncbi:MAG: pitrilysin family protein [Armatimonadota bacterium]|jgi:predicted Zn-dependent peptidase